MFAAGDHEDLGAALCAEVPRVRVMRRWRQPRDGGDAPPVDGLRRHDTLRPGHDGVYTFDDESDDVPQPIMVRRPAHALLTGRFGVIDILPDHPHEGEVTPDDEVPLDGWIDVEGYRAPEFPRVGDIQPRPHTEAWAQIRHDHPDDGFKGCVQPNVYGVIGAYDGHDAHVGRVVVDSTWHHWMDVNLTGRPVDLLDSKPCDATNPKTQGFLASSEGMSHLERIYTYFVNVALWLAPEGQQADMRRAAIWNALHTPPLVDVVTGRTDPLTLGRVVRAELERRWGTGMVRAWLHRVPTTP